MSATTTERFGIYLVGGRGSIGVAVMAGHAILCEGAVEVSGMVTGCSPFDRLPFAAWDRWVFGGCDIVAAPLLEVFENHLRARIMPTADRPCARRALAALDDRIEDVGALESEIVAGRGSPRAMVDALRQRLAAFKSRHRVDKVIVLNVASTEPLHPLQGRLQAARDWPELESLQAGIDGPLPWGVCYATAALLEGCAYLNFTPNLGTDLPALDDLAVRRGLPHAGKDGKTGETLLKSVLAPMFKERDLRVHAWQGYNMLGNNDGRSLSDPRAKAAKIASKDRQLRDILTNSKDLHTGVGIDYVPSLGDWKTAWDFIHFEGFLGAMMSLHLTWSGCDTALATPLVLDLVRFVELAWRSGESGHLSHLDAFFKSPTKARDHDFRRQMDRLRRYCSSWSGREVEVEASVSLEG